MTEPLSTFIFVRCPLCGSTVMTQFDVMPVHVGLQGKELDLCPGSLCAAEDIEKTFQNNVNKKMTIPSDIGDKK